MEKLTFIGVAIFICTLIMALTSVFDFYYKYVLNNIQYDAVMYVLRAFISILFAVLFFYSILVVIILLTKDKKK